MRNNSSPLLSIVIPTKNRAKYAYWAARAAACISPGFEVVVADSSPDDSLGASLRAEGRFNNIKYLKTSADNTVVDNFNQAVSFATGDFVTAIGDDDFISAEIVSVLEFAKTECADCVSFSFPATYWWPDFLHRRDGAANAASLRVNKFSRRFSRLNAVRNLELAARNLGGGPMEMPRIYAGLVSRKLINQVNEMYGNLFGGVSPDVYSSTLLASLGPRHIHYDCPVVVPGISGVSTSGKSSNGMHIGGLRDNDHLSPFRDLVWDERIPEFYSVPTVWSYSMVKALEVVGRLELANFISTYLKCFVYHKHYRSFTRRSLSMQYSNMSTLSAVAGLYGAVLSEANYLSTVLKSRSSSLVANRGSVIYRDIENCELASVVLRNHLSSSSY